MAISPNSGKGAESRYKTTKVVNPIVSYTTETASCLPVLTANERKVNGKATVAVKITVSLSRLVSHSPMIQATIVDVVAAIRTRQYTTTSFLFHKDAHAFFKDGTIRLRQFWFRSKAHSKVSTNNVKSSSVAISRVLSNYSPAMAV